MSELEKALENKPARAPMVSTLALRWQAAVPPGSGTAQLLPESPKAQEEAQEKHQKLPFCTIQWQYADSPP